MFDINSIEELIEALGGPSKLGSLLGIGDSAVCNWSARGFIPPSWHLRLSCELFEAGKTLNPEVFEITDERHRQILSRFFHRPKQRGTAQSVAA
jgi:hypothetical protein